MTEDNAEGLGLSLDMTAADRLRAWAQLILVYGNDISNWGDRLFVVSKMQIMATEIEHAVRDIGVLRKALADHCVQCPQCQQAARATAATAAKE